MASDYQVFICDAFGTILDVVDDWISLRYVRALNDTGSLTLILDGDYSPIDYLKLDGRIFIMRNGKIDTETCWLIRTITRTLDNQGLRTITVGGVGANDLLKRRVIAYTEDTSYTSKVNQADDMMKEIVRENLGTTASSFRNISSYLTIPSDTAQGPILYKEFSYSNVLDTLREISQSSVTAGSSVYFDIVATGFTTLEFRTYRDWRGVDHRFPGGLNPIIISPEMGNLVNCTRTYDYTSEVTYAYAGAQAAVYTASSQSRIGQSPFNLREGYVNVTGTSGSLAGIDEADGVVWAGRPKRTFRGTLVDVPGATEYGVQWGFGDAITVQFEGESIDCSIDSIDISVTDKKEDIRAGLRVIES